MKANRRGFIAAIAAALFGRKAVPNLVDQQFGVPFVFSKDRLALDIWPPIIPSGNQIITFDEYAREATAILRANVISGTYSNSL